MANRPLYERQTDEEVMSYVAIFFAFPLIIIAAVLATAVAIVLGPILLIAYVVFWFNRSQQPSKPVAVPYTPARSRTKPGYEAVKETWD